MRDCFRLDERVTLLPVVHRCGSNARAVEQWLLKNHFDCLAVPLPPSFRESVLAGVEQLPTISMVVQAPSMSTPWNLEYSDEDDDGDRGEDAEIPYSYVPIDPCQSVIAAIRFAIGERISVRFIDGETDPFEGDGAYASPDGFALREVSLEAFSAAVLPTLRRPTSPQVQSRITAMALRLRELREHHDHTVMLCSMVHWPWIREAYLELTDAPRRDAEELEVAPAINYSVDENTLVFLMGELPYITAVYEQARFELEGATHQTAIDGIKRLLMSARASYLTDLGKRARKVSPLMLSQCLKYMRNLTLMDRRLTPDMYTIVLAAKQTLGDPFAVHVAETVRNYAFQEPLPWPTVQLGIDQLRLPDGEVVRGISRLGENDSEWRTLELNRRPLKDESLKWRMQWNAYRQCSWLPEDAKIESFRTRVLDRARAILGADLARSEKFTTSLMDGIDVRETLRHWYDGQLFVKVQPPSVGHLDACLFLFDPQPDPHTYTWRTTWFAEHSWESTLAFYATDFREEILGPGIAVATYGGAMFLFPPRSIPDIWSDPELRFADTMEERLIAAACLHSQSKQIAILSPIPPTALWRRIAKKYGKSLVHVPLAQFSDAMIAQLRTVHVLNGKEVRSYAAHFIRKS